MLIRFWFFNLTVLSSRLSQVFTRSHLTTTTTTRGGVWSRELSWMVYHQGLTDSLAARLSWPSTNIRRTISYFRTLSPLSLTRPPAITREGAVTIYHPRCGPCTWELMWFAMSQFNWKLAISVLDWVLLSCQFLLSVPTGTVQSLCTNLTISGWSSSRQTDRGLPAHPLLAGAQWEDRERRHGGSTWVLEEINRVISTV